MTHSTHHPQLMHNPGTDPNQFPDDMIPEDVPVFSPDGAYEDTTPSGFNALETPHVVVGGTGKTKHVTAFSLRYWRYEDTELSGHAGERGPVRVESRYEEIGAAEHLSEKLDRLVRQAQETVVRRMDEGVEVVPTDDFSPHVA